ncbi:sigma-54 dependent transcriptional regulator [bacterium]|nr:sigma-54 dependent transcriptional regulator [bacterium]
MLQILIVDDEANIRKTLSYCLTGEGNAVIAVSNPSDAISEVKRRCFDLAFLDLKLGEENGMDLIPVFQSDSPWTKIVVITAHASIESAVEAMKRGATDYISKPFSPNQVRLITQKIEKLKDLETEITALREDARRSGPENRLESNNPGMQRIIEKLKKAAASEAIILFRGESGTGKSVFAQTVHQWSPRAKKPLVVVACPSIPADLLESELFGHTKGAFTGATRDNPGRIAMCEGGTLFLDEIGDIAPSTQAKLLRFIQDKEYERLGDSISRVADVRIIAATNANLEERVKNGQFREDLFYRLNVISLTVPALRERKEDILPLAHSFLTHFSGVNHKSFLGITKDAEVCLEKQQWPGNIRQLRNNIERAVILGNGQYLDWSDLSESPDQHNDTPSIGDKVSLSTIEELHIRRVLASTTSLQEAADILGIDQATLWRRRKTYGI